MNVSDDDDEEEKSEKSPSDKYLSDKHLSEKTLPEKYPSESEEVPIKETVALQSSEKPKAEPYFPKPIRYIKLFRFSQALDQVLMIIGIIGSIFTGLSAPANTFIFGDITNSLVNFIPGDEDDLLDDIDAFAINNTLIGLGVMVLSYISIVIYSYAIRRQIFKIRLLYFKASLRQEIAFYDTYGTAEFASRITEDLNKLEEGISEKVLQVVHSMSAFLGCVVLSLFKGWELALISMAAIPLIIISIKGISLLSKKVSETELEAYAKAAAVAQEVLGSIKTVVAFNGQKKERARYDKHLVRAMKNNVKKGFFNGGVFGVLWLLIYSAYGTAFWFGVQFVFDEKYTAGEMTTVLFSVMVGTINLIIVGPYIDTFSSATSAAAVIFWVIDRISAIDPTSDSGTTPDMKGNIEFKDVHFTYPTRPEVPVLKGISLKINVGETVALVGNSGCGKSTCLQLIQRFYDPTSGEILIDGENIKNMNVNFLRRHIGVVGQEPVLFSTTIKQNILYSKEDATPGEITEACEMANARNFISKLPMTYETAVGEKGAHLSGGQKQRIAIARALIRDPRILLLDEATSALDNESEAKVQTALESASKGRTTIIVAHRLSTIRKADKIVVLSKGEIVEEGTHEELYRKEGHYFELVTAQAHRLEEETEEDDAVSEKAHRRGSFISEREDATSPSKIDHPAETEVLKKIPWKEILRLNGPEWKWLLIGTLASVVIGCCYPIFTMLFGEIMGVFVSPREEALEEAKLYCLLYGVIGVVIGVSTFLQTVSFSIAGEKLTLRLRSQAFTAMLRQEMAWYDEKVNAIGTLCSRLTIDASNVQGATGYSMGAVMQAGATVLLSVVFSLFFQWQLGLVSMCLGPVLVGGYYFLFKNLKGGSNRSQKALEKSAKTVYESIGNIRTVAGLSREDAIYQQYKLELKPARKALIRSAHAKGITMGIARSLLFFAYAISMSYGGRLVVYEEQNYEDILKVTQTLIISSFCVAQAFSFTTNLQKGLTSAARICVLLMRHPKIRSPEAEPMPPTWTAQGDILYENIDFRYPTRPREPVLRNLNLEILKGKKIALVGQSGCGKSTLLQLLERFYDPDDGRVSLDQYDIKKIKLNHLRKQFGLVSQEPVLFDRTIGENIAYGDNERNVPDGEIIDAAIKANAHGFISSLPLGYNTYLGENGVKLSGGQKQRVAIARALIRNPKVLLLDEATSALDVQNERLVQTALDKASTGRTCIIIAHRLSTIVDADLIVVLSHGAIAEAGTHSELLSKRGIYRQLYTLQGRRPK